MKILRENLRVMELYKTRYLLATYTVFWGIYCWNFGMYNIHMDFRAEIVVKLICLILLTVFLFRRNEKAFKIIAIITFVMYAILLGNLIRYIITLYLSSRPKNNIFINIKEEWIILNSMIYRHGMSNIASFEEIFVTTIPGIYFLMQLIENKKWNITFSIIALFIVILTWYCSGWFFIEMSEYWNRWGIDLLNPFHNIAIFRILLDCIIFPVYIVINMILRIRDTSELTI